MPPGHCDRSWTDEPLYQRAGRAGSRLLIRNPFVPRPCHIRPNCEQNGEPDAPRLPPLTCPRRLGQDLEPPGLRRPPQLGSRRGEPRGDSSRVMTGPVCLIEDRSRDNGKVRDVAATCRPRVTPPCPADATTRSPTGFPITHGETHLFRFRGDLLPGEITAAVSGSKPDSQDKMRRSKAPSSTPAASHAALKAA